MSATTYHPACHGMSAVRRSSRSGILSLWFRRWRERARDRALLASLSDRELSDMRLTRYEAFNELAKPFWRG